MYSCQKSNTLVVNQFIKITSESYCCSRLFLVSPGSFTFLSFLSGLRKQQVRIMVWWLQLLLSKSPPHHACLEWSWLRTTLLSSLPTHQPHPSIWQTLLTNQLMRQRKATLVLMTRSLCSEQLSLEDLKIWLLYFHSLILILVVLTRSYWLM